ncbi:pyrroline-5-carboxylate reductase 3-like [Homalodisca vitripennis]|uniref:pyrroline-5-carboxylate reductase 3-like n=1 Tax=Homalodisca vitripennis TaxID=197043 RepID=UPI001EEAB753|nr:pyrroline-5-carboxylate reductase 3-like [Homalodisca vitripennis]
MSTSITNINNVDKPIIASKVGFVGAGNMAQAIVTGMLDAEIIMPDQVIVSAPSENNFSFWEEKGVKTTTVNAEVIRASDVIILSMKPQHLDEALKSFDRVPNNKLYISILAGISIETLNEKSGSGDKHKAVTAKHVQRDQPISISPTLPYRDLEHLRLKSGSVDKHKAVTAKYVQRDQPISMSPTLPYRDLGHLR